MILPHVMMIPEIMQTYYSHEYDDDSVNKKAKMSPKNSTSQRKNHPQKEEEQEEVIQLIDKKKLNSDRGKINKRLVVTCGAISLSCILLHFISKGHPSEAALQAILSLKFIHLTLASYHSPPLTFILSFVCGISLYFLDSTVTTIFVCVCLCCYWVSRYHPSSFGLYLEVAWASLSLWGVLYSSIMSSHSLEPLDLLFATAIVFVLYVGKYKSGVVKLSPMFNFMWAQVVLLSIFSLTLHLEGYNFTETDILWNRFPAILHGVIMKIFFYLLVLCLLMSGIHNVAFIFNDDDRDEDISDRYSLDYTYNMIINLTVLSY